MFFGSKENETKLLSLQEEINSLRSELEGKNKEIESSFKNHQLELQKVTKEKDVMIELFKTAASMSQQEGLVIFDKNNNAIFLNNNAKANLSNFNPILQAIRDGEEDVIMDGRDIGTTILPNAEVKIFLTASAKTRASRRYLELTEKGEACDMDEILKDIVDRDERDMNRAVSPLKKAEDAVLVDSSEMGIDEVVESILSVYRKRVNG